MPTDIAGIPLLPLIALIGGIIVFFKRDSLEYIVGIFLIGFGVLGLLPFVGVDVSDFNDRVREIARGADDNGGTN
ncbi:MAG: hypothetical protein AAFV62_01895 [Pseudomonadota bacterium]